MTSRNPNWLVLKCEGYRALRRCRHFGMKLQCKSTFICEIDKIKYFTNDVIRGRAASSHMSRLSASGLSHEEMWPTVLVLLLSLSTALWDVSAPLRLILVSLQVYSYRAAVRVFYWFLSTLPPAAGVTPHLSDLMLLVHRNSKNVFNVAQCRDWASLCGGAEIYQEC